MIILGTFYRVLAVLYYSKILCMPIYPITHETLRLGTGPDTYLDLFIRRYVM